MAQRKISIRTAIEKIISNYGDYTQTTKDKLKTRFLNGDTTYDFTYEKLLDELVKYDEYVLLTWRQGDEDAVLIDLFKAFKDNYLEQYQRIFKTITDSYNPLDNYNRDEETTLEISGTKASTESGTTGNSVINPQTTNTYSNLTNNSDTLKATEQSTNSGGTISQTTTHGKVSTDSFNNYKETTKFKAHGNLGVQTMNEVGGGEIKFRAYKLYAEFIYHFISEYGYYCIGIE